MRFKTDPVIGHVHKTPRYPHLAAVHDIHSVIVPISLAVHPDTIDPEPNALIVGFHQEAALASVISFNVTPLQLLK